MAPTLVHFLWVVCENGQLHHLIRILDAAEGRLADASGELRATVTSAAALHPGEQLIIAKQLQELSGCRDVRLKLRIDPKLLGGFVVRYNSRSIDCSGRTMGWPEWRGSFTRWRGAGACMRRNRRQVVSLLAMSGKPCAGLKCRLSPLYSRTHSQLQGGWPRSSKSSASGCQTETTCPESSPPQNTLEHRNVNCRRHCKEN